MKSKTKTNRTHRGTKEAIELPDPSGTDWLAFALGMIGGKPAAGENHVQAAARVLGVTRQRIYSWLEKGIGHLTFNQVIDIANRSGITVEMLKSRSGPHNYYKVSAGN